MIKIYTKTVPDENGLSVSFATSYRNITTFQNVLSDKGVAGDAFGLGAGARKLPNTFPTTNRITGQNRPSPEALQAFRQIVEKPEPLLPVFLL